MVRFVHGKAFSIAALLSAASAFAACNSTPESETRTDSSPALRAFVNEKGEFVAPPAEKWPENKPASDRFPTQRELDETRQPLPGGGYAYDVRGRLDTCLTAERDSDGGARIIERRPADGGDPQ